MVSAMHSEDWQKLKTQDERLQWARRNAGYETPADAAEALGMTGSAASTYFGHENGSRALTRAGARYADFFRISYDWLMRGHGAPTSAHARRRERSSTDEAIAIVGRVGAGPEGSIQFTDSPGGLGHAPAPPGANDRTVAVEVSGNSMRPIAFDGWLVYYEDRKSGLTPEMLGQPCIIGLPSGHTVMKTPQSGSKAGLYDLESANPTIDTMRDQRVKWAALVTAIVPRAPARRLAKTGRIKGNVGT